MDDQKLRRQIYEASLPLLQGKVVTDLVIGISLLAVELNHRDVAVSYVLREELKGGCSVFPYAQNTVGMTAADAALWFAEGQDAVQRSIGGAVINAVSSLIPLEDCREYPFGAEILPSDTVGMVGNIHPVAAALKKQGCSVFIFDKGQCPHGAPAGEIRPMEEQSLLLPKCDVVFLSGTTMLNGTAGTLFPLCSHAREVILIGSSTPMIPSGYQNTPVTVLAGSHWKNANKATVFRLISQAAGIKALGPYMIKRSVRI